jgi:hypothetical protein
MWNGYSIWPIAMSKLMVTPFCADEAPSRSLKLADDCPAVHAGVYDVHQGSPGQVAAGREGTA